ncbi:cation transporter [Acinetobacter sp. ASP199]|nr:cation transporter [Acinetobacter sp. ASP199]
MFQSLWNVAAAFCVHEEPITVNQSYHFGHHSNALCVSDTQHDRHQASESVSKTLDLGEDHQDHLPSMTHLILEQQQHSFIPLLFSLAVAPKYAWRNDYRSPDLNAQTPPPEFSPLMVG